MQPVYNVSHAIELLEFEKVNASNKSEIANCAFSYPRQKEYYK